jgi:predicted lipase
MVHAGFFIAWGSIKKEVYAAIESNDMSKIIVTGHSLGSGMAHVACTDIANKYPHLDMEVITFAGPRPGNRCFGMKCRERCPKMIRVVFDNDIVPNLPSMLFGYDHGDCDCLHLKADGTFTFKNNDSTWAVEFVRRFIKLFSFDLGVISHDIDFYIDALNMIDVDSEHFGTEDESINSE